MYTYVYIRFNFTYPTKCEEKTRISAIKFSLKTTILVEGILKSLTRIKFQNFKMNFKI